MIRVHLDADIIILPAKVDSVPSKTAADFRYEQAVQQFGAVAM